MEEYSHQVTNNDYKTDNYGRGQLYPAFHGFDENGKISMFTLTNVSFSDGSRQKMETCVRCILENYCSNNSVIEGHVVTGAQPRLNKKLNRRVNIPTILWSAFCCYSHKENKWIGSAHWGDNTAEDSTSEYLQTKTLAELRQELSIDAFPRTVSSP